MRKRIINTLYWTVGLFDLWVLLSFLNVANHTLTDHKYFWWNFFELFF